MNKKIAVIGCGIWGKNLVRNFHSLGCLYTGCDIDAELLESISKEYPEINFTNNIENIFNSKEIDGIAIATPSHTHYPLVKKALEAGKHVYVEKPIATCSEEAAELNKIADAKELVLMVGHLLLYHPAVNRLRSIVNEGQLGEIKYVQSDRLNINLFWNDRNVMWDLAPHDVSMISYILDSSPLDVTSSVGVSTNNDGIVDIAHIDLEFPENVHAHISNSWIHPIKRVMLIVRGTNATAVLDDTDSSNKLHIYDNFSTDKKTVEYPEYLEIEPLKLECQHFISCITNKIKPRSDGLNGYEVVNILEKAERIMLGKNYNRIHSFKLASSRKKAEKSSLTERLNKSAD